jgi:hypothetical protein
MRALSCRIYCRCRQSTHRREFKPNYQIVCLLPRCYPIDGAVLPKCVRADAAGMLYGLMTSRRPSGTLQDDQ